MYVCVLVCFIFINAYFAAAFSLLFRTHCSQLFALHIYNYLLMCVRVCALVY